MGAILFCLISCVSIGSANKNGRCILTNGYYKLRVEKYGPNRMDSRVLINDSILDYIEPPSFSETRLYWKTKELLEIEYTHLGRPDSITKEFNWIKDKRICNLYECIGDTLKFNCIYSDGSKNLPEYQMWLIKFN